MSDMRAWVHLHLPRLHAGAPDAISVKVPGQKIRYASYVGLTMAEFRVHEHGRQRSLREGRRTVHAWAVGDLAVLWEGGRPAVIPDWRRAVYDPWKGATFVDADTLRPVHRAETVALIGKDVFYQ